MPIGSKWVCYFGRVLYQLCLALYLIRSWSESPACLCIRGLLYCMEYLEENLDEWLAEELEVRTLCKVVTTARLHACQSLCKMCTDLHYCLCAKLCKSRLMLFSTRVTALLWCKRWYCHSACLYDAQLCSACILLLRCPAAVLSLT